MTLALAAGGCGSAPDPYIGLDADALFATAESEYTEGSYDNAVSALDRLLLAFGDWPGLPQARMLLAEAHFGAEDYLTARAEFVRFLDRYSGHADAAKAALGVCRSLAALSPTTARYQSYTRQAELPWRSLGSTEPTLRLGIRKKQTKPESVSSGITRTQAQPRICEATARSIP